MFPADSRKSKGKKYRVRFPYITECAAKVQDHLIYSTIDVSGAYTCSA